MRSSDDLRKLRMKRRDIYQIDSLHDSFQGNLPKLFTDEPKVFQRMITLRHENLEGVKAILTPTEYCRGFHMSIQKYQLY